MKKRDPLRTEAAIKKAVEKWGMGGAGLRDYDLSGFLKLTSYDVVFYRREKVIAIADLRDLYRKREPLRGITKAVRGAVHPRKRGKK